MSGHGGREEGGSRFLKLYYIDRQIVNMEKEDKQMWLFSLALTFHFYIFITVLHLKG